MIEPPDGMRLGAHHERDGTRFLLYSSVAEGVRLCLFDTGGKETRQLPLNDVGQNLWTVFVPGCEPGQRYGFRVDGPYDPARGLRCNPHKLLTDPYARLLDGELHWNSAVLGYAGDNPQDSRLCTLDSAAYVPKSVVTAVRPQLQTSRPHVAWRDTVIYELNVRGYTMRCADLSDAERGRFAGLSNGQIIDYLKSLGITGARVYRRIFSAQARAAQLLGL
jgi:glycogen operon protein